MSVLATIIAAAEHGAEAAEEHEKSETPFFVMGVVLVSFAVGISVLGMRKPEFPGDAAGQRGVMALTISLVLATMASIVYVST